MTVISPLIVDAHEDLSYNVLLDGRDYLQSAHATRAAEEGGPVPEGNGLCMLGLPEWLQARVALIVTTITAIPRSHANPSEMSYPNPEAAYRQAVAQLAIYREWVETHPQIALVTTAPQLEDVLNSWAPEAEPHRVGMILLIENADLIRQPEEVGWWYERGVRLIGPAWHSNRYTGSTIDGGPLTDLGRSLLREMERYGMLLDVSHMSDEACMEALDVFSGPVAATHANPRSLVPIQRNLPDEAIKGLIAHDGVIGIMPANWALDPAWRKPKTKEDIHIGAVVDAIDAVCQLAGDARHAGIGTDFDGGFGADSCPAEIDTIADLPKVADALAQRGYAESDVAAIMSENWLRVLRQALPSEPSPIERLRASGEIVPASADPDTLPDALPLRDGQEPPSAALSRLRRDER